MECLYNKDKCDCPKCFDCNRCTNGSQLHKSCSNGSQLHTSCFKIAPEDEEVKQLMAGVEESLPSIEDEEEMSAMQETTPLTAIDMVDELGYYAQLAKDTERDHEKITVPIANIPEGYRKFLPESAITDDTISVYRWLNEDCSILHYYIQKFLFTDVIRVRCNTMVQCYYNSDTKEIFHLDCLDLERDGQKVTPAVLVFRDVSQSDFGELMNNVKQLLFCDKCFNFMLLNGVEKMIPSCFVREWERVKKYELAILAEFEDRTVMQMYTKFTVNNPVSETDAE